MLAMGGRFLSLALMGLLLLLVPNVVTAQAGYDSAEPPSIGQPLLREGDLAVKLAQALSLGASQDEVEAENQLAGVGIAPKNGWIADYPVTPDIVAEVRQSVHSAASAGKIQFGADSALERLNGILVQAGLSVDTQESAKAEKTYPVDPAEPPSYQESTVINNYYETYGPPPVTYYAPPPAYSYLYGWVPYPFWSVGFWFPGFFILHDFHRPIFFDNRVVLVSNHFRDFREHRHFRIDPVARIRGHTIASTRVHHTGDFRDTRGAVTGRAASSGRTVVGEPRSQTVRSLNRGSTDGRDVAVGSIRSRSNVSGVDSGVRAPSGIPSNRGSTALSRGSIGSGRSTMGISRNGAGVVTGTGRDTRGFDRGSARVITRGDGFSGRGTRFEGMPSGSSIGQFRTVRSFSTSRGEGAFSPSVSRGSGVSVRGSGVMSLPRQGGSAGFSSGMSSRGFSGMRGSMGGGGFSGMRGGAGGSGRR